MFPIFLDFKWNYKSQDFLCFQLSVYFHALLSQTVRLFNLLFRLLIHQLIEIQLIQPLFTAFQSYCHSYSHFLKSLFSDVLSCFLTYLSQLIHCIFQFSVPVDDFIIYYLSSLLNTLPLTLNYLFFDTQLLFLINQFFILISHYLSLLQFLAFSLQRQCNSCYLNY